MAASGGIYRGFRTGENMFVVIAVGVALLIARLEASGPHCLECFDVPNPWECQKTTVCGAHEKCFTEQFVTSGGILLYNIGCLSNIRCSIHKRSSDDVINRQGREDIPTCTECCDGDFCNYQGCATFVPARPQRGPFCFNCDVLDDPTQCRDVKLCSSSEVCMLHEVDTETGKKYAASCSREPVCNALKSQFALIGRRSAHQHCYTCCNKDFCNDVCGTHAAIATPSTTVSTTTPTTTTATTTSTPTTLKTTCVPTTTATTPTTTHRHGTAVDPGTKCREDGYIFFGSIHLCYKLHTDRHTWVDAHRTCQMEHGDLVDLDTPLKWAFMNTILKGDHRYSHNVWVGARRWYNDGRFHWLRNQPIEPKHWGTNQPAGTSDCAMIKTSGDYLLHVDQCEHKLMFVCGKVVP